MGLADCFPVPRRVTLRGAGYLAWELRLKHLAAIEAAAADFWGDPLDDADPADRAAYRAALRAAYDRAGADDSAERDAGGWGSEECDAFALGTPEGRAMLLGLVLRADESLLPGEAAALAEDLAPEDWARVDRVAFAPDRLAYVQALIDRECGAEVPPPPPGESMPWEEAVAGVARRYRLGPPAIGELFVSQFRLLRTGGRRGDLLAHRLPPGWSPEAFDARVMRPRREFWRGADGG